MRRFLLPWILLAVCITGLGFLEPVPNLSSFEREAEYVKIRLIAHRLLQFAGDSSSSLPAIQSPTTSSYRITFNQSFSFQPDSVVQIIGTVLNNTHADYLVKVLAPGKKEPVFGFAILNSQQTSVIPCSGREQKNAPYVVEILFNRSSAVLNNGLKAGGLLLLVSGLVTAAVSRRKKEASTAVHPALPKETAPQMPHGYWLGNYQFKPESRILQLNEHRHELTNKEAVLLELFAKEPNSVIERARLMKEVWQDEGVLVSRSLDMFVSKLRKKLEGDPTIQLRNVHGKGYGIFIQQADSIK